MKRKNRPKGDQLEIRTKSDGQIDRPPILAWKNHFTIAIVLGVFLFLFGLLTVSSFLQKSPTIDEPVHLLAGYSYLKWGDFRVNPEHPPLAKMLAALPLLWLDVKDPRPTDPDWERIPDLTLGADIRIARNMFSVYNDAETLFFYAKLPMIGLGMILGLFVFLCAKDLYGLLAASIAVFVYCLDPNILAHSQIVHTDISFATFYFVSCYFFWRTLHHLNWTNLSLTCVAFGLASITKYSFVTMVPVWGALGLCSIILSESSQCSVFVSRVVSGRWERIALFLGTMACAFCVAYLFIWSAYGFRFDAIPGRNQSLLFAPLPLMENPLANHFVSIIREHRLLPEAWLYGQLYLFNDLSRPTYLLGEISSNGFWSYFPVAFIVKTPLPTLVMLVVALVAWSLRPSARRTLLVLLIPPLLYFVAAMGSKLNIGLRHILPVYPFVFVVVGAIAAELWTSKAIVKRCFLVVLGCWYVWSSTMIYPHYLAYFNELAGGPENGHRVLIDSNLDWGQDLKGLKRWMDRHGQTSIQLHYFGSIYPEYYGIKAFHLPGSSGALQSPQHEENFRLPEYLAISVNRLFGEKVFINEAQKRFIDSYKLGPPIENIGYSILIYKLDLSDAKVHYNAGGILARRGELDHAVEQFREALRIQPEFADAHSELAQVLAAQGNRDEAVKHYNEALRLLKALPRAPKSG